MNRIVRILTQGRELEAINRDVVAAIDGGTRVLVKAARVSDSIPMKPDGDKGAVADWAEALSQQHGLVWQRVGLDVLFTRPGMG
jgi:hypothetical protein